MYCTCTRNCTYVHTPTTYNILYRSAVSVLKTNSATYLGLRDLRIPILVLNAFHFELQDFTSSFSDFLIAFRTQLVSLANLIHSTLGNANCRDDPFSTTARHPLPSVLAHVRTAVSIGAL